MMVLVDTDILIEVSRGRNHDVLTKWKELLESRVLVFYTPVTAAELWGGIFHHEQKALKALLDGLECLPLDYETGYIAGRYLKQYRKSHGLALGDALIAAAAVQNDAALWTRNRKHFPMKDLVLY
ncbi:MAG TPA: type II toxin-antitoxin system VapC family toxin [Pseudacidobacterium sp.]|jgi:predicted nucleic acid-binding protein|nr:type II toxin-antitoxin system VapC family toxin [Pseudacidobacterium sp.]